MAGNNDDLGSQLGLQQQINKVLQQRTGLLAQQAKVMTAQVQVAAELCNALDCKELEGMNTRLTEIRDGLNGAAEEAQKARDATEGLATGGSKAAGVFDKIGKAAPKIGLLAGSLAGIRSAFKGSWNLLKGFGKGIFGVAKSVGKLAMTIISAPFKMLSGLIGMAQQGGGGSNPLREALEEVREQAGSLATNEGKMLSDSVGQMRSEMKDMAGTGLSMGKVFGYGPGGLAAFLKENAELAKEVGAGFGNLRAEFAKNSVALAMYRKGLGMTNEQQAVMLKMAKARGKSMIEEQTAFASMAINMGKQFDINAKVVAKSMSTMAADVSNFGSLSRAELGATAVYAEKLGVSIKDMMGVIDKFDNFEDAAKGAAQLSQAFGMNVDAMEMMNAQSPAARIDQLRKAFHATGKSVENMTRQERKLLETQTGLSGAALEGAFSQENMGLSYEELAAAGEDAEDKTLSQAEAMKELADSIKKLTRSGGGTNFKSFFDAFAQGFTKGITKSKEMRGIFKNIRKSLKVVHRSGKRVGKMFVKMFPGVKKMMGGIKELFNPKTFKKLMGGVEKEFEKFFKMIRTDPKKGVEGLIKGLKNAFKKFFGKKGSAAKDVAEGGKTFLKTLGGVLKGLLIVVVTKVTEGINYLVELMRNPPAVASALGETFSNFFSAMGDLFGELFKKLGPPLGRALSNLMEVMWEKAKPLIMAYLPKIGAAILGTALFRMIMNVARGGVVGQAIKFLFQGMANMMKTTAEETVGGAEEEIAGPFQSFGEKLNNFICHMAKVNIKDLLKVGFIILPLMIASLIPMAGAFALSLAAIAPMFSGLDWKTIGMGLFGMAGALASVALLLKMTKCVEMAHAAKAIVLLPLLALSLGTGGTVFAEAVQKIAPIIGGIDLGAMAKTAIAMAAMALVMFPMAALVKYAGKIPLKAAAMSIIILPVVALAMSLGVAVFMGAMLLLIPLMKKLESAGFKESSDGFMTLAKVMGALSLAMIAVVAGGIAAVGAIVALIPISIFLGLMCETGLLTYLETAAKAFKKMDLGTAVEGFSKLAAIFGIMILATGSAALAGIPALAGTIALIPIGLFLVGTNEFIIPALVYFSREAKKIKDWKATSTAWMELAGIMVSLAAAAGSTVLAGAASLLAIFLLPIVADFMYGISETGGFMDGVQQFVKHKGYSSLSEGSLPRTVKNLGVLMKELGGIQKSVASIAGYALLAGLFSIFSGGPFQAIRDLFAGLICVGEDNRLSKLNALQSNFTDAVPTVQAMGIFFTELGKIDESIHGLETAVGWGAIFSKGDPFAPIKSLMKGLLSVGPQVAEIEKFPISDPKRVSLVMSALGPVFAALEGLGNIALGLAEMDVAAMDKGSKESGKAIQAIDCMIQTLSGTINSMITNMKTMLTEVDIKDLEKASMMAPLFEAMGTMMTGLQPPPQLFDAMRTVTETSEASMLPWKDADTRKTVKMEASAASPVMEALAAYVKVMVLTMISTLPDMIKAVNAGVAVLPDGAELEKFKKKAEVLVTVVGVISEISKVIMDMNKQSLELMKGEGLIAEAAQAAISAAQPNAGIAMIAKSFCSLAGALKTSLPEMIQAVWDATKVFEGKEDVDKKLDLITKAFAVVTKMGAMMKDLFEAGGEGGMQGGTGIGAFDAAAQIKGEIDKATATSGPIDKITSGMTSLTTTLKKCLPTLIKSITEIDINVGPDTEKKMGIIERAWKTVSNMGQMIGKFHGMSKVKVGKKESHNMQSLMLGVTALVENLAGEEGKPGSIKKLFCAVQTVAKSIPTGDIGTMTKKFDIVSKAFEVIGSFASSMSSLMGLVPATTGDGKQVGNRVHKVSTMITEMVGALADTPEMSSTAMGFIEVTPGKDGALKTMFCAVDAVVKMIPSKFWGYGKKVKIVSDAFGIIGTMASAISSIMSLIPAGTAKNPKTVSERATEAVTLLNTVVPVIGKCMGKIAGDLGTMIGTKEVINLGRNHGRVKSLAKTFKVLATMAGSLTEFSKLGSGTADPTKIKEHLTAIEKVLDPRKAATNYGTIPGVVYEINRMFKGESKVDFSKLGTANKGFGALRKVLNTMNAAMKQSNLTQTDEIANIEKNVASIKRITDTVVKIDEDAKVLFKGGKLQVWHNLKKVEMKVEVHIDSKKLGQSILATDLSAKSDRGYMVTGKSKGMVLGGE